MISIFNLAPLVRSQSIKNYEKSKHFRTNVKQITTLTKVKAIIQSFYIATTQKSKLAE
jgi:hypothetical protein